MTWVHVHVLWCLLVPLALLATSQRGTAKRIWPGLARVAVSRNGVCAATERRARIPWLLLLAASLGIIALARPRWGAASQTIEEPAREVMIALDLSRSMLVDDVTPTRIDRAHEVMTQLLDGLGGERAGLIVFAGTAYVQVPLSSDYQIIREFLPELRPGFLPQGGSDYTAMLRAAQESFGESKDVDRFLSVISDGESTTNGWPAELARLQPRSVHVIGLGVGTAGGGDVPANAREEKSPGRSQLESATLQKLAAASQGMYRDVTTALDVKGLLAETVELGRRNRQAEREVEHQEERFQWFLLAAVAAALLGLWHEIAVRPRARTIARHAPSVRGPAERAVIAGAVVAAILVTTPWRSLRAHDLADEADEPITAVGKLRKLVAHVAAHPFLDLNDLKRIGELTVSYGIESFAKGENVSEGALTDGLEAVRYGEQMAPDFADWSELRSALKRLQAHPPESGEPKQRPPEQKKEALDEEDRPPQTNGQGTQQTSSESTGKGGVAMTDATLGELRKEPGRAPGSIAEPTRPRAVSAPPDAATAARIASSPLRTLMMKRFREVVKEDKPGELFQALNGEVPTKSPGGKDW